MFNVMINQTNDYSISEQQSVNTQNTGRSKSNPNSTLPETGKLTVWRSPELAEFDLCMEVTAYVHQWE
jgi:hypothetical protein